MLHSAPCAWYDGSRDHKYEVRTYSTEEWSAIGFRQLIYALTGQVNSTAGLLCLLNSKMCLFPLSTSNYSSCIDDSKLAESGVFSLSMFGTLKCLVGPLGRIHLPGSRSK